jgi:hypothetical protein
VDGIPHVKANVVMLPTDGTSSIARDKEGLHYAKNYGFDLFDIKNNFQHTNRQHLYFTTDEEIKDGDWVYDSQYQKVYEATYVVIHNMKTLEYPYLKKVVATTDTSLKVSKFSTGVFSDLKYLLPTPSPEFIKAYIKNPIFEVLIEVGFETHTELKDYYKIKTNSLNQITVKMVQETKEEAARKYAEKSYYQDGGIEEAFLAGVEWANKQNNYERQENIKK